MKVLSIKEPYATLIRYGMKMMETRSWKTKYRGEIYIHASGKRIPREYRKNAELMELAAGREMGFGHIICKAKLVDCVLMTEEFIEEVKKNHNEYVSGFYSVGRYAWILEDVEVIDPIEAKGHLGIWNYEK